MKDVHILYLMVCDGKPSVGMPPLKSAFRKMFFATVTFEHVTLKILLVSYGPDTIE